MQILKENKRKVLVAGKFDLLHPGHLKLFEMAKKKGNYLTIVLARDETIVKETGNYPSYNENLRKEFLESIDLVDEVILGNFENKLEILKEIKPDVICLGYDQEMPEHAISLFLQEENINCEVIRLEPFKEHIFKSSLIKESIKNSTNN